MFPLWYLLIPYGIFLGLTTLFVFFNIFHIWSFGLQSLKTSLIILAYLVSYLAVVWISFTLLADVPWEQNINLRTIIHLPSFTGSASSDDL
jgi:hypothetical protein